MSESFTCGPDCDPATCVHMYDEFFPGEECCAGRFIKGSPILLHEEDCPVYQQNLRAINEHYDKLRRDRETGRDAQVSDSPERETAP